MFSFLPSEILQIILQYASLKYRHGEYIHQIPQNDIRCILLQNIQPIKYKKSIF